MAKSTGIVLAGTAISFGNDWLQTDNLNFKIPIAGLGVALLFAGVEMLNEQAGIGLSVIFLITVLVVPIHGQPPATTLVNAMGAKPKTGVQTTPIQGH